MPEKNKKVSCTISVPAPDRDWLLRFAEKAGHVRTHPTTGDVEGNMSWAANEAISFLQHNYLLYTKQQGERLSEFEGSGNGDAGQ